MDITPNRNKMRFTGVMLLAVLLLWLSPAYGGTITENFANNQYNTNLWYLVNQWNQGTASAAQVSNDRLEVTVAGDGVGGLSGDGFTLMGDFDMQADFTLINWPAGNNTQVTIGTNTKDSGYLFSVGRANAPTNVMNPGEQYFITSIDDNNTSTGVTGPTLSGTLRMVRTGNTMQGFYWNGTAWQSIGSTTDANLGTRVGVSLGIGPYANSYSGISAKAAFSNIQINYTTLGPSFFQVNAAPGIMELLLD